MKPFVGAAVAAALSTLLVALVGSTSPASVSDIVPSEWEEGIAIYSADFKMSRTAALEAVSGQERRILFRDAMITRWPDEVAGFTYTPTTNTTEVLVTTPEAALAAVELGQVHGVHVNTSLVEYSLSDLTQLAHTVQKGTYLPLKGLAKRASVDDASNTVEVYVESPQEVAAQLSGLTLHPSIRLRRYDDPKTTDEACNNKQTGCGSPLRGGIGIWRGVGQEPLCSLGYTATAADGSWWAVTAGHCIGAEPLNTVFGHGEQFFGPARQVNNNNNNNNFERVDVLRARIDNAYWRAARPGGWLVNVGANNVIRDEPVPLDYVITARSTIEVNEIVCLGALSPEPGDACGRISDEFSTNNTPRVEYDACPGDSGGAWTWRTSSGALWGYGVHEGGRLGCPRQDTGGLNGSQGHSTFTTIPDLNDYWDATTAVQLRIDQR